VSYLDKLKSTGNRKDLAKLLGFKPKALTAIIYQTPLSRRYTEFEIPKKSGGTRTIKAPNEKLKKLQRHLAHVLYACLTEIEESQNSRAVSFGFRKKGTISANAKNHKRRRYVLNLDLTDFFPSFNFGRVRGYFLKDRSFALNEEVATTIAQIACDGQALPQGSPCSPVISELIGRILDIRLLRLARKHGVTYSRYADDITFSTNQREFPSSLAVQNDKDLSIWALGDELVSKISASGFTINPNKTRMQCRGSRQMVTGLVVNEKVNIRSDYYRRARAMCDSLFQSGQYFCSYINSDEPDEEQKPDYTDNSNYLEGILGHIYSITQTEERRDIQEQRKKPRAIRELYRRFLFYRKCVAPDKPLIITEGKTDPIYLKAAIRRRTTFHPVLGQPGKEGFECAIRFFNYGGQAHEIMDLGGGAGDLRSIPLDYLRNFKEDNSKRKPIKHKPMSWPVILLLDNDDGLEQVASTINKNFGVSINLKSTDNFYHITENLYLVKTPEINDESCIEDMFPKKWRNKKLNGKRFNSARKINPEKEYGKEIFAKAVVQANVDKIDFADFDPLLNRISLVLADYSSV